MNSCTELTISESIKIPHPSELCYSFVDDVNNLVSIWFELNISRDHSEVLTESYRDFLIDFQNSNFSLIVSLMFQKLYTRVFSISSYFNQWKTMFTQELVLHLKRYEIRLIILYLKFNCPIKVSFFVLLIQNGHFCFFNQNFWSCN